MKKQAVLKICGLLLLQVVGGCLVNSATAIACKVPHVDQSKNPEEIPLGRVKVKIVGNTVFQRQDFEQAFQKAKIEDGQAIDYPKLADLITQMYADRQYITSKAIAQGQEIKIFEGSLENITLEGTKRLNTAYICERIQRGTGVPLNTQKLEEQLRLLKADPLFANVEAVLQDSGKIGQSILKVTVTEAPALTSSVSPGFLTSILKKGPHA